MSWEANVRRVIPYTPGEQPKTTNLIKLNTNECPYPPAPAVQEALKHINYDEMRLYPSPGADSLVEAIANYYQVKPTQVFVGVGSDDVIAQAFLTFFNSNKPILFPDITYSFYDVWADLYRIPYEKQPLDENFHICPQDYKKENGGIIFPNPNAPTGLMEELSVIEEIVAANPEQVVMIDEAYVDFGADSALPLIEKYDNLLVIQTFSKSRAMAGMRIGFAIGNEKMIRYLSDVKFSVNSYTMNRPSLILGPLAIEDDTYFKETTEKIISTREWMKREMKALGFDFPDSKSNFIFARHESMPAKQLQSALREKNIFVRYFDKPRIDNYLRITVGTQQEAEVLMKALKEILNRA